MDRSRLRPASVGAVVTLVTSFVPFSPLLGGCVAGWLAAGDERTSATVGVLSGVLASVVFLPLLALGLLLVPVDTGFTLAVMTVISLVGTLYFASFAALGGVAAAALRDRMCGDPPAGYDADREIRRLRRRYADGDITDSEFERRVERVLAADRRQQKRVRASDDRTEPEIRRY